MKKFCGGVTKIVIVLAIAVIVADYIGLITATTVNLSWSREVLPWRWERLQLIFVGYGVATFIVGAWFHFFWWKCSAYHQKRRRDNGPRKMVE